MSEFKRFKNPIYCPSSHHNGVRGIQNVIIAWVDSIEIAALEQANEKIRELEKQLTESEDSCLQLIDERDLREDQINDIADTLGDFREWSSQNDRGLNCIESLHLLHDQYGNLEEKIKELEAKLSIAVGALKCNETFHRLGGIDDCEPCQALEKLRGEK